MKTKQFYVCEKCNSPIMGTPIETKSEIETVKVDQYDRVKTIAGPGAYHATCLSELVGNYEREY